MRKVFITRDLGVTDFFKIELEKVGFSVFGNSLIEFSKVAIQSIPDCDWLFFYSKNAVRFFIEQIDFQLIKSKKIATIGQATAHFIVNKYSLDVDFIGTGSPSETAKKFIKLAANSTVLFPRALTSKQSIQKELGHSIIQKDLVIYKNQPKTNFEITNADILVFTSPINAKAYFNKIDLKANQQVIAIGNTTAKALFELGIQKVRIASEPSEKGLVKCIL